MSIINGSNSLFGVYFYSQLQKYESRLKPIFILTKITKMNNNFLNQYRNSDTYRHSQSDMHKGLP